MKHRQDNNKKCFFTWCKCQIGQQKCSRKKKRKEKRQKTVSTNKGLVALRWFNNALDTTEK